jgi:hypothetical protein
MTAGAGAATAAAAAAAAATDAAAATAAAALVASDQCPRCGGGFHCGVNDSVPCACSTVTLSAALLADLRQRYSSCLCQRCLLELAG